MNIYANTSVANLTIRWSSFGHDSGDSSAAVEYQSRTASIYFRLIYSSQLRVDGYCPICIFPASLTTEINLRTIAQWAMTSWEKFFFSRSLNGPSSRRNVNFSFSANLQCSSSVGSLLLNIHKIRIAIVRLNVMKRLAHPVERLNISVACWMLLINCNLRISSWWERLINCEDYSSLAASWTDDKKNDEWLLADFKL